MISLRKMTDFDNFTQIAKMIVAKGFEKIPKVQ